MKQYLLNLAMAIDQFASTMLGGHPDDTVSQRLGRALLDKPNWVVKASAKAIDWFALVIVGESDHCLNSLRGKAMAKELWNWGGDRSMVKVHDDELTPT